jgi:predicted anti-sigma-YlaC factor YlaD
MLSAQLDGEDGPGDRVRIEEHLSGCAGCRAWLDQAAAVNRLTRTSVVGSVPDLSEAILAALPTGAPRVAARSAPKRERLAVVLFRALGAVGAVQLILGLAQVGGGSTGGHSHAAAGLTATPGHLWHESAAWNVALGAGFLFMALRRTRPTGLVPMLTAFVGMLLLLSVNDLSGGRVDAARLVSHGFVIGGYLIVLALSRVTAGPSEPPGQRTAAGSGWRARFDDAPAPASGLRLVRRSSGGPVTAQAATAQAAVAQAVVAQIATVQAAAVQVVVDGGERRAA